MDDGFTYLPGKPYFDPPKVVIQLDQDHQVHGAKILSTQPAYMTQVKY